MIITNNIIIMAKFTIGQVVQLNSGGPEMTISNVIDSDNPGQWKLYVLRWKAENPYAKVWYQTQWFEGKELKKEIFIEEVLYAVEE